MPDALVMFSPLPPAKSGIADYAQELLPTLARHRPVFVVCERPPAVPPAGCELLAPADYAQRHDLRDLPHLHQIGNNADHVFVYRAFRERPGILVQHDFNLHYLVEDATLVQGDVAGYREILHEEYGEPGATLADLRQAGLFSEAQKIALPLNTHLLRRARGLLVHSRWVHDRLPPEIWPRTAVVPHHYAPQADAYAGLSRAQARERLGLPPDAVVVLSLGYITPPKQIQMVLAALALLRRRGQSVLYVIGGQRNPGFDIDAHVRRHDLQDHVRVTGFLDEDAFFTHIVAADLLCNLRHPTVGESSGTLARALAIGRPAVVHDFGPFSEFPDDVVVKVPLELGAPVVLAAALSRLIDDADLRRHIGAAAFAYMREHCSVDHSARQYLALVDRLHGSVPAPAPALTQ